MRRLVAIAGLVFGLLFLWVAWKGYLDMQALSGEARIERVPVADRRVDQDAFAIRTPRFLIHLQGREHWLDLNGSPDTVGDALWVRYIPGERPLPEIFAQRPHASAWHDSRYARQFWMAAIAAPLFVLGGLAIGWGYGPRGVRDALTRYAQSVSPPKPIVQDKEE